MTISTVPVVIGTEAPALRRPTSNEDLDAGLGSQLSQRARTGVVRSQAIVNGACGFRRHDSRLTAIWTFHRHGSLLRDQDRAPFGGQPGASTPNCLAYEAGAEASPMGSTQRAQRRRLLALLRPKQPAVRGQAPAGVACRRRQKKYESPQSTPVAAAQPHASGPSPTERWAMSAEARLMAKPA